MESKHVCPWWLGYFLISPVRKWMHNPDKILGDYIKPGMQAIDYGSAMGYFSLPMAKKVGNTGKVYCFDIQGKMLNKLARRAKNAGLENIIPRLILSDRNAFTDLAQTADFALLFAVAHEVPDQKQLFQELSGMMKSKALLLFSEPAGHVKAEEFAQSVSLAENAGFKKLMKLEISRSFAVLFQKS